MALASRVTLKSLTSLSLSEMVLSLMFPLCVSFTSRNCAPGEWNNSVRHSNDVLQARAKVKNNEYKDVYGLVKAFAPAIAGMSGRLS